MRFKHSVWIHSRTKIPFLKQKSDKLPESNAKASCTHQETIDRLQTKLDESRQQVHDKEQVNKNMNDKLRWMEEQLKEVTQQRDQILQDKEAAFTR